MSTTTVSNCPNCGSSQFVSGQMSEGGIGGGYGFKPDRLRKFFSLTGLVKVKATACRQCGLLRLFVDPEKLADMAE
jgi:hypothetical protein